MEGRRARANPGTTRNPQLGAPNVELRTVERLRGVEREHLAPQQVVAAGQVGGQLEAVRHILRLHDLVCPFAVDVVELVDLGPGADARGLLRVGDGAKEAVGDGARVRGGVPLDFDGVAGLGAADGDGAGDDVAVYVAGYVVGCYVGLGEGL